MPRPLRIEYEGARYHVMSRGNRGSVVFGSDADVGLFLRTLGEACKRSDLRVNAYVLMSTHYHLLIETPSGNLVEGMKWLQGAFTQRMNAMHKTWGHLFQGRYKAKIIDPTDLTYFKRVAEYIHLNPASAGLLGRTTPQKLSSYTWSSYPSYLAPSRKRPEWLYTGPVLGEHHLGDTAGDRRRFAAYMEDRSHWAATKEKAFQKDYKGMERGWIHGAQEFRDQMSDWLEERQQGAEKSSDADQKRDLTERAVKQRIKEGCRFLHIPIDQLKKMRKGDESKVLLAAYIKEHYSLSNQRISELLHMGHPTSISKCGGTVQHDRRLRKKYQHLKGKLSHG